MNQLTLPTARAGTECTRCGGHGVETGAVPSSLDDSCRRCGGSGQARASDPPTSHRAAASIGRGVEEAVLRIHRKHDGLCDDELVDVLIPDGCTSPILHPPTVKSARSRLSKRGLLRDSGETRLSARGKPSIVWVVA